MTDVPPPPEELMEAARRAGATQYAADESNPPLFDASAIGNHANKSRGIRKNVSGVWVKAFLQAFKGI